MKQRLIITALLGMVTLLIHAGDINEQQACQIAAKMMPGFCSTPSLAYTAKKDGRNNLYVFNNDADDGFVIVSGSDQTTASVLGYSDKGHFDYDKAPENLKSLLAMYEEQIIAVRSKKTNARVTRSEEIGNVVVSPLLKTTWNQEAPYNNM